MRLALCGGIFCCFLVVAFYIYRGYYQRKMFFESAISFCNHLVTEIGFSKKSVVQIIDFYIDGYSREFAQMLCGYRALVERRQDITRDRIAVWQRLRAAEASVMREFFLELGRHAVAEECEKVRSARCRFEEFYADAVERLRRDASIYFKICILLGVGVVILLL